MSLPPFRWWLQRAEQVLGPLPVEFIDHKPATHRRMAVNTRGRERRRIFKHYDRNGDGVLDFHEMMILAADLHVEFHPSHASGQEAFDREELEEMVEEILEQIEVHQDHCVGRWNGTVEYQEFEPWMRDQEMKYLQIQPRPIAPRNESILRFNALRSRMNLCRWRRLTKVLVPALPKQCKARPVASPRLTHSRSHDALKQLVAGHRKEHAFERAMVRSHSLDDVSTEHLLSGSNGPRHTRPEAVIWHGSIRHGVISPSVKARGLAVGDVSSRCKKRQIPARTAAANVGPVAAATDTAPETEGTDAADPLGFSPTLVMGLSVILALMVAPLVLVSFSAVAHRLSASAAVARSRKSQNMSGATFSQADMHAAPAAIEYRTTQYYHPPITRRSITLGARWERLGDGLGKHGGAFACGEKNTPACLHPVSARQRSASCKQDAVLSGTCDDADESLGTMRKTNLTVCQTHRQLHQRNTASASKSGRLTR